MSKINFEVHETLTEMTLMMKFYLCLQNFSELRVPLEIFFSIISGKYLHVYLLENAKKVFNILNIILVSDFCPLND